MLKLVWASDFWKPLVHTNMSKILENIEMMMMIVITKVTLTVKRKKPMTFMDHTWRRTVHSDHYVIGNFPGAGSDWGFL